MSSAISKPRSPVVDPADFPPVEADEPLEPGLRKSVTLLRGFADPPHGKPKRMVFDFFAKPVRIEGDDKVERIIVERTELDEKGAARGTGETYAIPASLVITAIGYSTSPIADVPFEGGKFVNAKGRIADRLYAVGWARRGPTRHDRHQPPGRIRGRRSGRGGHARRKLGRARRRQGPETLARSSRGDGDRL